MSSKEKLHLLGTAGVRWRCLFL